jgi:choline dehydrogenase-like flavoprotein
LRFWNKDPAAPATAALRGSPISDTFTGDVWGDELLEEIPDASTNHRVGVSAQVELLPDASNQVSLDPSTTDSHGNPVPDISLSVGAHALETCKRANEIMTDILTEMGATDITTTDPQSQAIGNHHKGTTRMGSDPSSSVVDSTLRTHDLDNLWLVSSSVFPTGGAVNPTLTIGALALKAATHLDDAL